MPRQDPDAPPDATGAAPGKLILVGEHAVVYGARAVAAAVTRAPDDADPGDPARDPADPARDPARDPDLSACGDGTTVQLRRRPGPSGIDRADISDPRLWPALRAVLPPDLRDHGLGLTVRSRLPVGSGMGSSAALAVATVRAVAGLEGREASFDECYTLGFAVERAFHGTPSGIDHTVAAMGGLCRYRRASGSQAAGPQVERMPAPPLAWIVTDTGRPDRSTAEMVAGVRARMPAEALIRIAVLVEDFCQCLRRGVTSDADVTEIGRLLNENHDLLREIGVSTDRLDAACAAMREAGALGAKLAGAGGGGVAIAALPPDRAGAALRRLRAAGWQAWRVGIAPERGL